MRRTFFPLFVIMILTAAGLACSLGGATIESVPTSPPQTQASQINTQVVVAINPTAGELPWVVGAQPAGPPTVVAHAAIPEPRRLTLDYPPYIRVADSEIIQLTLDLNPPGNVVAAAEAPGNVAGGKIVPIPDIYAAHDVFAEARLDLAGPNVQPPDIQSESLTPGQAVTFFWRVQPTSAGTFRGIVWFYLRFVDKVSGAESRRTLSAQPVQIEANTFFGFSGGFARLAGGIGSIVGAVLGFPFADDLLKWLFSRFKKSE
ncbi:MAG TPA: hypothetical protein VLX61_16860 [Anaerolineales bacterium]|nr:hypothetical protein [Anaerolineales bacterium]